MRDYMVTTFDNKINPFTHFTEWYDRDDQLGYHTCQWLDKYAITSIELPDDVRERDIKAGIDEFLARNPFGMHYKVYKDEADTLIPLLYNAYKKIESQNNDPS